MSDKVRTSLNKALLWGFVAVLTACQNRFEVAQSIHQSVAENKNAATLREWQSSKVHPEKLFAQWNQEVASGQASLEDKSREVCQGLTDLDALSLTVFELQINRAPEALLEECRHDLQKKLNDHYAVERDTLSVTPDSDGTWSPGFQFPENIQRRDISNGYYAWTGDVAPKEIILTFDDGPSAEYTDSILATLKAVNAKAIFFNQGKNVQAHPEVARRVGAAGHGIGSHTMAHFCLAPNSLCQGKNGFLLSFEQALQEIRNAHILLFKNLGWVDPFFRFPYGESSPELRAFLKEHSVAEFNWNMDSEDWRAVSHQQLLEKALSEIHRAGRGIILFHDIQRRTAEVLPQFLTEVYNQGYRVVLLQPADPQARYNSRLVPTDPKP